MEVPGTLTESLLDDLDDLMDSDEEEPQAEETVSSMAEPQQVPSAGAGAFDNNEESRPVAPVSSGVAVKVTHSSLSRPFLDNPNLQKHLSKIQKWQIQKGNRHEDKELLEEDHQLVVQSNKFLATLSEEIGKSHGALAAAYNPKFPELEELLPNPVQYKNAVRCIGNEMDLTRVNDQLNEILNSNQIITISVAGSTTSGRPLTPEELAKVDAAATYMEQLVEVQDQLVGFVEQSMEALVPSVCALVGSSTAAKLLGLTGGLAELTKIPACNLQVLGQIKQNAASRAGMSAANTKQHVGILADCDLVRSVPKPLQKKALKMVAAKLALAARCDYVNVDTGRPRSALAGQQFRQEVQQKFEKLQEPDKAPVLKALPK